MKTNFLQAASLSTLFLSMIACSKVNFGNAQISSQLSAPLSGVSSGADLIVNQPNTGTSISNPNKITLPPAINLPPGGQFPGCANQLTFSHDPVAYLNSHGPLVVTDEFINNIQNADSSVQVTNKKLGNVNNVKGPFEFETTELGEISDMENTVTGSAECITEIQNISHNVTISDDKSSTGFLGQIQNIHGGDVVLNNFNMNNVQNITGSLTITNSNILELSGITGKILLTNVRVRYLHNVKGHVTLINSVIEQSDESDLH